MNERARQNDGRVNTGYNVHQQRCNQRHWRHWLSLLYVVWFELLIFELQKYRGFLWQLAEWLLKGKATKQMRKYWNDSSSNIRNIIRTHGHRGSQAPFADDSWKFPLCFAYPPRRRAYCTEFFIKMHKWNWFRCKAYGFWVALPLIPHPWTSQTAHHLQFWRLRWSFVRRF